MLHVIVRLFIFGALGITIEVLWTGLNARLRFGNSHYEGCSYGWMLPVYGFGGLGFDWLRLHSMDVGVSEGWLIPLYVVLIFILEAVYGGLLKALIGSIPWEYKSGWHWRGLVKWSYAPLWLLVSVFFNTFARHIQ